MKLGEHIHTRGLTGLERLRLFAGMPDTFTFDEDDAQNAVAEIDKNLNELWRVERMMESLEQLRPHWAQGYSSDSMAAQAHASALAAVWTFLGVDNQTDCMQKLRALSATPTQVDAVSA